jgi:cysteinyl-tRNA synthetase
VFGLGLAQWQPVEVVIPENAQVLLDQRETARCEKRWQDADSLRAQIRALGFEIEDTGAGAVLKKK